MLLYMSYTEVIYRSHIPKSYTEVIYRSHIPKTRLEQKISAKESIDEAKVHRIEEELAAKKVRNEAG